MHQYHDFLRHILTVGHRKGDRTGTGTFSTFGYQMRFDLTKGFPLVTTKKIHLKSVIHELLWFFSGNTNVKYLQDNGVSIWDEWAVPEDVYETQAVTDLESYQIFCQHHAGGDEEAAGHHFRRYLINQLTDSGMLNRNDVIMRQNIYISSTIDLLRLYPKECTAVFDSCAIPREKRVLIKKKGDLGRVYGAQWRDWIGPNGEHIDQIMKVIQRLKTHPDCRRLIVTAWQPAEVEQMALPPCHAFFQFWTRELSLTERLALLNKEHEDSKIKFMDTIPGADPDRQAAFLDKMNIPRRGLTCQLYQRKQHCALAA